MIIVKGRRPGRAFVVVGVFPNTYDGRLEAERAARAADGLRDVIIIDDVTGSLLFSHDHWHRSE